MSAIRGMNAGFFCGMRIGEFSIDLSTEVNRVPSFDGEVYARHGLGLSSASISLTMLAESYQRDLFELFDSSVYTLGEGAVCPYCGDYNPAGLTCCHRCGGNTEWRPDATLRKLPFLIERCAVSNLGNDLFAVDISLMSTGDFTQRDASCIIGRDIENGFAELDTEFFWGRTDFFLCQYCGQAVKEGQVCQSCNGVRVPWSEILKMDRECIYCGTKVFGGIVCPGCGRRLAGLTLAEQKRKGVV